MTTLATDHLGQFVVRHPTVAETAGDFSIVNIRPRHEKVFVRELRAENIGYYLPLRRNVRFWHGRRRESYVPIFPCKIFVANGDEGREIAARSWCARGFTPLAKSYQPILRSELSVLETVLANQPEANAHPLFVHGRRVQVRQDSGHWAAGLRGVIDYRHEQSQQDRERAVFCVLIETMGRVVPLENVPLELLELVDADAA